MSSSYHFQLPGCYSKDRRVAKKARVNKSMGRTSACTPQCLVVQTVKLFADSVPRCTNPEEPNWEAKFCAPMSRNPQVFTPKKGEIMLTVIDRGEERYQNMGTTATIQGPTVFSAVNGLSRYTRVRVAGVIDYASDLDNPTRDDVGTLRIAGTATINNTGGEYIPAGAMVYVDPVAYISQDPNTGKTVPGVQIIGNPADKYLAATITMRDTDVVCFIDMVEREIEKWFMDHPQPDIHLDELKSFMREHLCILETCELWDFALLTAAHLGLIGTDSNNDKWFDHFPRVDFSMNQINAFEEKQKLLLQRFGCAIGADEFEPSPWKLPGNLSIGTTQTEWGNVGPDDTTSIALLITKQLEHCKRLALDAYRGYIERFKLGVALNGAAPGGQIDCLLSHRAS